MPRKSPLVQNSHTQSQPRAVATSGVRAQRLRHLLAALTLSLIAACGGAEGTGPTSDILPNTTADATAGTASASAVAPSSSAVSDPSATGVLPTSAPSASPTGSSGNGQAGVVAGDHCYALCTSTTMGTADEPDWGFENDASCVIPSSPTAIAAQSCVVGMPLPPAADAPHVPGVVLSAVCYPLCRVVTTPSDAAAPDWGYETGSSCVLPGTKTAVAQQCTTNEALPDPALLDPRPGVVVLDDDHMRRCAALCTASTDPAADPDGDDWDYEYGDSCVIPSSPTSLNQACMTGAPPPDPLPKPGVVVVDGAKAAECIPLCVVNNDPALDRELDGWAYEDNSSCVIPGTAAAVTNTPCTTGQALPQEAPRAGVVVKVSDSEITCVPSCTFYASPTQDGANDDGLADDWGWENNSACIIADTTTQLANQTCTTGEALPDPVPRPGIYVNSDPVENSCTSNECVPLCTVVTEGLDAEYPDWGWEFNHSCILPGTVTATVISGDSAKSIENHGYVVPPRTCTWGAPQPDFLAPPPLDAAKTVKPYFYTDGGTLRDAYGQPFLIRGVNNSDAWYDTCGQYAAYGALDNIAAAGANAVRVGWAFKTINPGGVADDADPTKAEKAVVGTNPALLAEILHRIVELKMVPILAPNDSTGQTATSWPLTLAQDLTAPGYREVLRAYEPYLLLGIANEWNGTDFGPAYAAAIKHLRDEGVHAALVVTGNDWGQGCQAILDDAAGLINGDADKNVLFDIHIYTYITYPLAGASNPDAGGESERVTGCLDAIASKNIPLVVGEFGHTHSSGDVAWETIIARADANQQGYVPWLWYGDTEFPALNMNETWEGPLTSWGTSAMTNIRSSSHIASVFQ